VLYVYALADRVGDISDLKGVRGESLVLLHVADLVVVAGEMDGTPALSAATLHAQDALIRTLHARAAALLPMQFGTTQPGEGDLVRLLERRDDLGSKLEKVCGCDQMTVRVLAATQQERGTMMPERQDAQAPNDGDELPGTRYLAARRRGAAAAPPLLQGIAEAAATLSRDVRIEPAQLGGVAGTIYHLIERGRADEYRRVIERAAAAVSGVRVVISGPSPPYAFA